MLNLNSKIVIGTGLVILGISLRFLPHPYNFVPISAIALFSAVYLGRLPALILPVLTMFLSDLFIGFYQWTLMSAVYGTFLLIGLIGWWLKKNKKITAVLGCSLLASVLFFIITNWAVWQFTNWYPKNLPGLIESYLMALPFFKNTLLGDLFYISSFFGIYELLAVLVRKKLTYLDRSVNPVRSLE